MAPRFPKARRAKEPVKVKEPEIDMWQGMRDIAVSKADRDFQALWAYLEVFVGRPLEMHEVETFDDNLLSACLGDYYSESQMDEARAEEFERGLEEGKEHGDAHEYRRGLNDGAGKGVDHLIETIRHAYIPDFEDPDPTVTEDAKVLLALWKDLDLEFDKMGEASVRSVKE